MKKFIEELKERKIRKWLAIYVSTSITTIGIVHLLSIRYKLDSYIFDIIFFTLLFGIGTVFISAWFHGKEGKQKTGKLEIAIHTIVVIAWMTFMYNRITFDQTDYSEFDRNTIAVLPFTNFSDDKENEYFADGITDDILTQLSKISGLKVISRTSVMKYKNLNLSMKDISKQLEAGTILEGSVRKYGNKIRIVGQLIDANTDTHLWSETYDREFKDIFNIQSEIAERIAASLHTQLLPLEKKQLKHKSTSNITAYTYYLKGKELYYNYSEDDNNKAIDYFNKALKVDSNYALAYAGLADTYNQRVSKYWYPDSLIDSALIFSKRAIKINPNLAEAYKALASSYQSQNKYELAIANYKRAIQLNPNFWSAIVNYGQILTFLGQHDEALYWIRRANELAPNDLFGTISVSLVYKNLNCQNAAINWCTKAIKMEEENKFANFYMGEIYLSAGDFNNSRKYFKKTIKLDSNWVFGWFLGGRIETALHNYQLAKDYFDNYLKIAQSSPEWYYAHVLFNLNQSDSAKKILENEIEEYTKYFEENKTPQVFDYIALAEMFAMNNETDNSFYWWKYAINKGFTDINRIKFFPYFDNIKSDSRYNKYLLDMESKIDSFKKEIKNKYPEYYECNLN